MISLCSPGRMQNSICNPPLPSQQRSPTFLVQQVLTPIPWPRPNNISALKVLNLTRETPRNLHNIVLTKGFPQKPRDSEPERRRFVRRFLRRCSHREERATCWLLA